MNAPFKRRILFIISTLLVMGLNFSSKDPGNFYNAKAKIPLINLFQSQILCDTKAIEVREYPISSSRVIARIAPNQPVARNWRQPPNDGFVEIAYPIPRRPHITGYVLQRQVCAEIESKPHCPTCA